MIPKSSAIHSVFHMMLVCAKETDGNGTTVKTVLFDYQKAFELVDHNVLFKKFVLCLPNCVVKWIIDFLSSRLQQNKLAD